MDNQNKMQGTPPAPQNFPATRAAVERYKSNKQAQKQAQKELDRIEAAVTECAALLPTQLPEQVDLNIDVKSDNAEEYIDLALCLCFSLTAYPRIAAFAILNNKDSKKSIHKCINEGFVQAHAINAMPVILAALKKVTTEVIDSVICATFELGVEIHNVH